jgi:hypothetical protein
MQMTKHEIAHPHDLLTRSILADPELAASLLTHYVESKTAAEAIAQTCLYRVRA